MALDVRTVELSDWNDPVCGRDDRSPSGLRGDLTLARVGLFLVIGILSFLIASQVWKRGLKQYSGASS